MTLNTLYEIFCDGGSRGNPGHGASAFIVYLDKNVIYRESYYLKNTTNNIAEYFAVLMATAWVVKNQKNIEADKIDFFLDSELVVRQINGIYKIKNEKLKNIFNKIKINLTKTEKKFIFHHIKREMNTHADMLVNEKIDENV